MTFTHEAASSSEEGGDLFSWQRVAYGRSWYASLMVAALLLTNNALTSTDALASTDAAAPAAAADFYSVTDLSVDYVLVESTVRPRINWALEILTAAESFEIELQDASNGARDLLLDPPNERANHGPVTVGDSVTGSYVDSFFTTGQSAGYYFFVFVDVDGDLDTEGDFEVGVHQPPQRRVPGPPQDTYLFRVAAVPSVDESMIISRVSWEDLNDALLQIKGYVDVLGYELAYRFGEDDWEFITHADSGATMADRQLLTADHTNATMCTIACPENAVDCITTPFPCVEYDHVIPAAQVQPGTIEYRVRGVNIFTRLEGATQGTWSDVNSVSVVGAPRNLTAALQANGAVQLSWDKASNDDGTTITVTSYEVRQRVRGETTGTVQTVAAAEQLAYTVPKTDVVPGVVYSWFVVAVSADAPLGVPSAAVIASNPIVDLDADGSVGMDDALILYYSLALGTGFDPATDVANGVAGPLLRTFVGGFVRGDTGATDAAVLAAWSRALRVGEFGDGIVGSINDTPGVDSGDALILYYARAFRELLGDGSTGGFQSLRSDLLTVPSGVTTPEDDQLREMLRRANQFFAGRN